MTLGKDLQREILLSEEVILPFGPLRGNKSGRTADKRSRHPGRARGTYDLRTSFCTKGESLMDRREFAKVMGAVAAGLAAGTRVFAADAKPDDKAPKHICKSHNECKGKGGCKTDKNACAGKNDCKGKGGCAASAAKHECAKKNECKGMGGCKSGNNGCAGKNDCKSKGGCAVPVKAEHIKGEDKAKHACGGKSGCPGKEEKKK